MKNKILTLIFALTLTLTFAQKSEHLSFKGVPINGTLNEYVYKMKQKGFTHIVTEGCTALLNGDFAGYKDCHMGVSTLKQKDLVYKIGVIFPAQETWSRLSANYFDLKQMLTEKYGEPSKVVEEFDVESFKLPLDDKGKMYEVRFDNCKYHSTWKTDKGEIQISIDHNKVISCFVTIVYVDKINSAIINAKAKDDL